MINLIVCGAGGRMGSRILELASADSTFKIAGAIESGKHPDQGKKILNGAMAITSDLKSLKNSSDVLIDFTAPQATLDHLLEIQSWNKAAAVVGTTGFSPEELNQIKKVSEKTPVLIAPNMSQGVNAMLKLVRSAAQKLSGYDIEIIESHHNQKKDAPSGTALALAKEIAEELGRNPEKDFVYGREGSVGARKPKEIGIHAVRGGDIVGDHTVIFAGQGERIEITHRAASRDAFAVGALQAAKWIYGKKPGLYSMKDALA